MKCCVELKEVKRVINLLDTKNYISRIIRIWECPKCHFLKAQLQQYNTNTKRYEYDSPKRKHLSEWVKRYEQEPYTENLNLNQQHGTFQDMNWLYGDGLNIRDFNNTIRGKRY